MLFFFTTASDTPILLRTRLHELTHSDVYRYPYQAHTMMQHPASGSRTASNPAFIASASTVSNSPRYGESHSFEPFDALSIMTA
jgi:hypothetical protein